MNGFGASGPLPHTRYLAGSGSISWSFNRTATAGSPLKLAAGTAITDDDGIGGVVSGVSDGTDWCASLPPRPHSVGMS